MVLRRIETKIPTVEQLMLPRILNELVMEKRGIIIFVGATGTGKSTSLAAMIGHRNRNSSGHIISVEDPIEFVHQHEGCIITQREVGIDTESFEVALRNTLRQAPDVILIGKKCWIRSSAWLALLACRVASTRCPVSAKVMAFCMVSKVRISPIRMTSGA